MKTIHALGLLGAALLAACTERPSVTAPISNANAPLVAELVGDRPYTWSVKCNGNGLADAILARWHWSMDGVAIIGSDNSAYCLGGVVTGTGTRPGNANGFDACVGNGGPGMTCQSWTFDPASAFSAQLKGSYEFCYLHQWNQIKCDKVSGLLRVDS